jgi:exonuclease SbcC
VLDGITVQSGTDRTVALLELLHELNSYHQVILFSQEDEVMRWAQQHLEPPTDKMSRLMNPTDGYGRGISPESDQRLPTSPAP